RLEMLERAVFLEYGIEMTDEQDAFSSRSLVLGEEVAGAMGCIHGDPSGLEMERAELLGEDIADLAYAVEVHRPAVHVYEALEQGDRFVVVRIDVGRDFRLRRVERARRFDCRGARRFDRRRGGWVCGRAWRRRACGGHESDQPQP